MKNEDQRLDGDYDIHVPLITKNKREIMLRKIRIITDDEIEREMDVRGIFGTWDRMNGRTMARWVRDNIVESTCNSTKI